MIFHAHPSKHSPCVGIRTCSDYSPFGVELDGRTVSNYGYRFGYQGSEKDNEFKGNGNSYTTEFRQLDPRLGRWLTRDALEKKYSYFSPFIALGNNPIIYFDIDGKDIVYFDKIGNEVVSKRVVSKDIYETYVQTSVDKGNAVYTKVTMPNRITIYSNYEKEVNRDYNKFDYDIAAQTFLFNQKKKAGTLPDKGQGGDPSGVPDLDPNVVKSLILRESLYGYATGKNASVDVMQSNVTGDWAEKKKEIGLTKGSTASAKLSISAGIVWLYWKGITISPTKDSNGKVTGYKATWIGGNDWKIAVKNYNGGGDPNYIENFNKVMQALKNGASKDGYAEQKAKETRNNNGKKEK